MKTDPLGRLLTALRGPELRPTQSAPEQNDTATSGNRRLAAEADAVVVADSIKTRAQGLQEQQSRIESLKKAVENGDYSVSSTEVAKKFISELAL